MSMKIAKATPFEGVPKITSADIFGASTGKGLLYRIPVIGKRPIKLTVCGLAAGLSFNGREIVGKVANDCEFTVHIVAENELGKSEKDILFKIAPDNPLRTPMLGFTTWNAYAHNVKQEEVERAAECIDKTGLAEYGYSYVNLDSGWQDRYGGKYDAIMPNKRFPDIKGMIDKIHSYGLKAGIYSTPMRNAWGCPSDYEWIPGCTRGEKDIRFNYDLMGGIGVERCEANNVKQWVEWGVDYLKYDWAPSDAYNADLMKQELLKADREIAFCVTVAAMIEYGEYFKRNVNHWRTNADSESKWSNITARMGKSIEAWRPYIQEGHFYDLDMLETGLTKLNGGVRYLTDNEQVFAYTQRAFFMSPIQLSCWVDQMTEHEFNIYCNEEIIAINQDTKFDLPHLVPEWSGDKLFVFKRELSNGDIAIGVFNCLDGYESINIKLDGEYKVRDVWAKEDIGVSDTVSYISECHSAQVFRLSK